ncbi:MAG: TlpA family protein disulfide reductase [Elusimicrobia bacterium]|nr:TlpA family protein disulfide reductase [Elusimicrobiota bacterium]
MSFRTRAAAALALSAAFFLIACRPNVSGLPVSVRRPAPDFAAVDINGRKLSLSDYKGEVVLLDFWATWCEPCRTEVPEFARLQRKYGSQGFQVIGVSLDDDPRPVRDFYARRRMNYPVFLGDAKLAESFGGILGLPVAFLIDRDGRIHAKYAGRTDAAVFDRDVRAALERRAE